MTIDTSFITDFIFVENVIAPCDVILVPGGSHPQLAEKAAELYLAGIGKYILFSGRANPYITTHATEAQWLKSLAVKLGVPEDFVICECDAANTFENAQFSYELLKKTNIPADKIMLVCKEFHSRRALRTYQYCFPQVTEFFVASVTDKRGLCRDNWTTKTEYVEKVMGEVKKIGKYFKDKI